MKNTVNFLTVVTDADVVAALERAQEADRDARDARLWASKEYVNEADRKSEAAWDEYLVMRQREMSERVRAFKARSQASK